MDRIGERKGMHGLFYVAGCLNEFKNPLASLFS